MSAEISKEKREALLRRIQALREKTIERGCTEAEAAQAADTCQRLMDDYGVTLSDIQAAPDKDQLCEEGYADTGTKSIPHMVRYCQQAIGEYTNTKVWRNGSRLCYFGLIADVEIAKYLTDCFRVAMDTEWKAYWQSIKSTTWDAPITARKGFMLGIAQTLRTQLQVLRQAHELEVSAEVATTSRALMVIKRDLVKHAWDKHVKGWKWTKGYTSSYEGEHDHLAAGREAGERINIPSGGIGDRPKPKEIL